PERKRAADNAEEDECRHSPLKGLGLGNGQHLLAKLERQPGEQREPAGTGHKVDGEQLPQRVIKRGGRGNYHRERERRRSKSAERNSWAGMRADPVLQLFIPLLPSQL